MKNKHFTFTIILIFVAIISGFFAGTYYSGSKTNSSTNTQNSTRGAALNSTRSRAGGFGGGVTGEIISKDSQSITITLPSGGSQIVFVNPSTNILKSISGTLDDLSTGTTVVVSGTTNSDGSSLTANSINIRPAQVASSTTQGN